MRPLGEVDNRQPAMAEGDRPVAPDPFVIGAASRQPVEHRADQAEIGPAASFIHSYSGHGVVESALTAPWRRRIVARFALTERVG